MVANTGRTVGKWIKFQIDDSGGVVRDIPVSSIGGVGIGHDEVDLTALQDALKGMLPGHGAVAVDITGPFDNSAVATASVSTEAPALSGSHTVLEPVNGLAVPLTLGIYYGIRHYWETGEPAFGVTSTATSGILVFDYKVNDDGTYSAAIRPYPGTTGLDWGTAAYT